MRKGGSTDADLGVLARREKLGAIAGRARAASEALVSMAVCAAGIEATPETLAYCSLGQNRHEAFESEKECFYFQILGFCHGSVFMEMICVQLYSALLNPPPHGSHMVLF